MVFRTGGAAGMSARAAAQQPAMSCTSPPSRIIPGNVSRAEVENPDRKPLQTLSNKDFANLLVGRRSEVVGEVRFMFVV